MDRKPVISRIFLAPLVVLIMLLSVVGLWVGRGICVGIVVVLLGGWYF